MINQRSLRTDDIAGAKPKTYDRIGRKNYANIENNYIKQQTFENRVFPNLKQQNDYNQIHNNEVVDTLKKNYGVSKEKNKNFPINNIINQAVDGGLEDKESYLNYEKFLGDDKITPLHSKVYNYYDMKPPQNQTLSNKKENQLLEDHQFYENYKKFFGDDNNTPGPQKNNYSYQQAPHKGTPKTNQQNDSLEKEEEFRKNIDKFFGLDDSEKKSIPYSYYKNPTKSQHQNNQANSLENQEISNSDNLKFHRKNIFHNDVYVVTKTNKYNPITCQIMGVFNQNEITNDYLTTNNKGYGKPLLNNNLDSLVYEQNLQSTYNTAKSVKKEETSLFGDLNDNSKLAGKKQFDRLKIDQNVFNNNNQPIENVFANPFGKKQYQDKSKLEYNVVNPTSEILGNNSFGKKQFQDNKLKADFNVLNNGTYDLNKEFILNEIGKKKFHEKAKADFNVISGKKNEEGKYVSAKQEFQLDTKGEEFFKKKLTENSNNLANLFAGKAYNKIEIMNNA